MASSVLVGDTVRLQVTFYDWESDSQNPIDPDSVVVDVLDSQLVRTAEVEQPVVRTDIGVYYYDWTPTQTGLFYVEFKGVYSGGQTSISREEILVTESPTSTTADSVTLEEDQELVFLTPLSPLYVDPEEFYSYFPEALPVEISELVYKYSLEVDNLRKGDEVGIVALEYIRAATMCSLGKIYDIVGDDVSIELGDLSVQAKSRYKTKVTRATASTWCELAAVLRNELIRTRARMRSIVKGSAFTNPMPARILRDKTKG